MNRFYSTVTLLTLILIMGGCASSGFTAADKRKSVLDMKNAALAELYKTKPDVRAQINSAPGYAVFSNANVYLIFASVGGGYGVVTDNHAGKNIYMKMGELGAGFGAGAKDFRLVFVFHTRDALNRFVEQGWAFGGQADAAAKAGQKGGAVGGEAIIDNVTVYQLTESGLALQATVKGTKFWKDKALN